jgi:dihydrofolate reductase
MRRVRYQVASSLDGFIAGPNGEYDWIVMDPDIDFDALFAEFDTLLMGRRTYQMMAGNSFGKHVVVFSRTLDPAEHPNVTMVADNIRERIDDLRAAEGRDIWLFGGGELFRTLLALDCVDTVEPAVIPILLGAGIPFLPTPAVRTRLALEDHRLYPKSGIVLLKYRVEREPPERTRSRARKR